MRARVSLEGYRQLETRALFAIFLYYKVYNYYYRLFSCFVL